MGGLESVLAAGAAAAMGGLMGTMFGSTPPPAPQVPPGYYDEIKAQRMRYENLEKEFKEFQMNNAHDHTGISRYKKLLQEVEEEERELKKSSRNAP